MRARALLGIVAVVCAAQASAGVARGDESPAEAPSTFVTVDFDRIPRGVVPPILSATDAPSSPAAEAQAEGVSMQKVVLPPRRRVQKKSRKLAPGLAAKAVRVDAVQILPEKPEVDALYVPDASASESDGEAAGPLVCQKDLNPTPLRWETLVADSHDAAHVDVKDLWFFGATCSVTAGTTAQMKFAAVAWDGAKPWLYAMRDDRSVTFLMPRATDVAVDTAFGAPVTVRGGFTRVSLPLGRWGAETFVAHLTSLDVTALPTPPPSAHQAKAKGQGQGHATKPAPDPPAATSTDGEPVEVEVELVQTMSETSPTILVRSSRPAPDTDAMPHRAPDEM